MSVIVDGAGGKASAPPQPHIPRAALGLGFQEVTFLGAAEREDFTWILSGYWSVWPSLLQVVRRQSEVLQVSW